MGTVNPRGAHECGALGSAQGCAQSSAVPLVVAHRIERNPDWKVFLNMAAAAGALIHVRSAPQALTRAGGGRQGERPGQVLVHVSQPALARLGLCRNAFSRWGLLVHVTTRSAELRPLSVPTKPMPVAVCEWGGPRARHNPVPPHPAS